MRAAASARGIRMQCLRAGMRISIASIRGSTAFSNPPSFIKLLFSMTHADLKTMVAYHYWARDRAIEALVMLTPEHYNRDLGGSLKSIRDRATHPSGAGGGGHERWQGR